MILRPLVILIQLLPLPWPWVPRTILPHRIQHQTLPGWITVLDWHSGGSRN